MWQCWSNVNNVGNVGGGKEQAESLGVVKLVRWSEEFV